MEQSNYTTNRKKHKHILKNDRYIIEKMLNAGCKDAEISRVLGCSEKTLKREIKRGTWEYPDEKYSPEAALMKAKETGFAVEISVKTLYNNIDNGDIGVTSKDLLRKKRLETG